MIVHACLPNPETNANTHPRDVLGWQMPCVQHKWNHMVTPGTSCDANGLLTGWLTVSRLATGHTWQASRRTETPGEDKSPPGISRPTIRFVFPRTSHEPSTAGFGSIQMPRDPLD